MRDDAMIDKSSIRLSVGDAVPIVLFLHKN